MLRDIITILYLTNLFVSFKIYRELVDAGWRITVWGFLMLLLCVACMTLWTLAMFYAWTCN